MIHDNIFIMGPLWKWIQEFFEFFERVMRRHPAMTSRIAFFYLKTVVQTRECRIWREVKTQSSTIDTHTCVNCICVFTIDWYVNSVLNINSSLCSNNRHCALREGIELRIIRIRRLVDVDTEKKNWKTFFFLDHVFML